MSRPRGVDQELNMKALVAFVIGLVVLIVVSGVLMAGLSGLLYGLETAGDPPPPVLEEARAPYVPPGPRLQADPIAELQRLREREAEVLDSYGWVDEAAGIAQIPVARAIELVAAGELPLSGGAP